MAIQIGTVDGLVNITEENISCFVKAINNFDEECVKYAKEKEIPLRAAFQRFVEPVYSGTKERFDVKDISVKALTKTGNEQSPARGTYCRKMGLLRVDEIKDIFELTPLAVEIFNEKISIKEYAFILLTKQGIFKDGVYQTNLFSFIAKWFAHNSIISESILLDSVKNEYGNSSVEKTRADIIVNALVLCELITYVDKGIYVLKDLNSAEIFKDFFLNEQCLSDSLLDNDINYTSSIGSLKHGVFDILTEENWDIYKIKYPNIGKYISKQPKSVDFPSCVCQAKKLTDFILKCVEYCKEIDNLNSIVPYAADVDVNNPIKVSKEGSFSLVGMFLEADFEEVKKRNDQHSRWFENSFSLGDRTVYLSTQWNASGDYQLTLSDFEKLIQTCYGDKFYYRLGESGEHELWIKGDSKDTSANKFPLPSPLQRILYGAPGTGKSFSVKDTIKKHCGEDLDMEGERVFRTTFHPDYDYAQFVGCYKPTKEGDKITYDFVPQVFTQALIKSYENLDESVYLVIEEINRGNCAQIFGDIFQLLDRNSETGVSEYSINVDEDLRKYLEEKCPAAIKDGKIKLPRNFNIIATMNTSDQSLFPMDSAFKRRWDWKYVAVKYGNDVKSKDFTITIGDKEKGTDQVYNWHTFLEAVNKKIKDVTKSEDKQMGNFFIKQSVNEEEFCNKVMFYLWNDVSKDYYESNDSLFQCKTNDGTAHFSFNELFGDQQTTLLKGFMEFIGCKVKTSSDGNGGGQQNTDDASQGDTQSE